MRLSNSVLKLIVFSAAVFVSGTANSADPLSPGAVSKDPSAPLNWTVQQDHQNMMAQLGITKLRPGPSGRPGAPNSANYDPAKANPFPDLPDPLVLKNGEKVTTAEIWWKQRRPEMSRISNVKSSAVCQKEFRK